MPPYATVISNPEVPYHKAIVIHGGIVIWQGPLLDISDPDEWPKASELHLNPEDFRSFYEYSTNRRRAN